MKVEEWCKIGKDWKHVNDVRWMGGGHGRVGPIIDKAGPGSFIIQSARFECFTASPDSLLDRV